MIRRESSLQDGSPCEECIQCNEWKNKENEPHARSADHSMKRRCHFRALSVGWGQKVEKIVILSQCMRVILAQGPC